MEIWKDIEGYEGLYQVSNLGNIKALGNGGSNSKERILNPQKNNKCYLQVGLRKQGKRKFYLIHRLVAEAFINNPQNLPQINHKDEDKTNNQVNNLEWCDCQYNIDYSLSKQVLCVEIDKIYTSAHQVEKELGFSNSNIRKCCRGKQKTCGGYTWRYVS
jgi:hypothetical protein